MKKAPTWLNKTAKAYWRRFHSGDLSDQAAELLPYFVTLWRPTAKHPKFYPPRG